MRGCAATLRGRRFAKGKLRHLTFQRVRNIGFDSKKCAIGKKRRRKPLERFGSRQLKETGDHLEVNVGRLSKDYESESRKSPEEVNRAGYSQPPYNYSRYNLQPKKE